MKIGFQNAIISSARFGRSKSGNQIFSIGIFLLGCVCSAIAQEEPFAAIEEYHDNVVIVLDASGSMNQRMRGSGVQKMEAAKSALKSVLRNVPGTTHIGLLVFSAKDLRNDWVYPLGPRDEMRLLEAIARPVPESGTPLGKYIKIGADRLLEARARQYGYGTYRLLIVTDGDANDPQLVDRYTPEVLARGIIVDVIGVDMKTDHTLASMAHSYRRANDPDSLERAIQEVFAELSSDADEFSMKEAFELIAPIPVECATAALQALSTFGNQPIGERARPSSGYPQPASAGDSHQGRTAQSSSQAPPPASDGNKPFRNFLLPGIVFLLLFLIIAKKLSR